MFFPPQTRAFSAFPYPSTPATGHRRKTLRTHSCGQNYTQVASTGLFRRCACASSKAGCNPEIRSRIIYTSSVRDLCMAVIRQISTSRPSVKFPDLWISFPQRQNDRVLSPGTSDRFPMRKDDDVGRPNCNLCLEGLRQARA